MNIGFIINFNKQDWIGGYNYYLHLFNGLKNRKNSKFKPVIILDNKNRLLNNKELKKFDYIISDLFSNKSSLQRIINKLLIILFGKNFLIEKFFIKNNIYKVSHTSFFGNKSRIKSYPWFPDFQEYYLPQFFSWKKIILRKINLYLAYRHSSGIIVSSKSVYDDLLKIYPKAIKKTKILRHNNSLISRKSLLNKKFLKKKFSIKKKFFLVPNHYWKHKNHMCILKALTKLKNVDFTIISTGRCDDHRNPYYFNKIRKFINKHNLNDHYKILGLVNFNELISLMYHSCAVINPSKFEGWGNSASMALSMGKPVIVSNIKTHKELKGKSIFYFSPNNFIELSKLFKKLSKKIFLKKSFKKSVNENNIKTEEFINNYLKILEEK
jgi:hypothetical protein